MTDSDVKAETWKAVPGVQWWYEASDRGRIQSLDHKDRNGRPHKGTVLNPRPDGDGYLVVNVTLEDGTRKHGMSVARLVLLAHAGEPPQPDMQACHGPGGQKDNRWPENLRWGTDEENRADWRRDNPPVPKPLKVCVRCGAGFNTKGNRCRPCITWFAEEGARRMAGGMDPEQAAREVDYPSAIGLIRLGMKHAGLRFVVTPREDPAVVTLSDNRRRLRRVLFRREASRQNSDAQ